MHNYLYIIVLFFCIIYTIWYNILVNFNKKNRWAGKPKPAERRYFMIREEINGKSITFMTATECRGKSNKQLLNLLRTHDIRNIRECGCAQEGCSNRGSRGTMRAVLAVGKGHGFRYLCPKHYGLNGLSSYHNGVTADTTYIGSKKNTSLASTSIGVEFEVVVKSGKDTPLLNIFRTALANFACARQEEDATVCAEFPTGAFVGINSLSKLLDSFEKYGILDALTSNERCGAHIHAGCICVEYVRENYEALFKPLADYINNLQSEDKIKYFGSDFRDWARCPIWYNPNNHTNIFNTQHACTLEFRLPRCISAKQYLQCVKAWRAVVCEINLSHKKESAEKIGKRLPEVFMKYYNFMNDYYELKW